MYKKMKNKSMCVVICLLLLCSFYLFIPAKKGVFAEDTTTVFNKDVSYHVYYEVSKFELDCAADVKILGAETIDGVTFLVIKSTGLTAKTGYILFVNVKAILPSGSIKPNRTFDVKK